MVDLMLNVQHKKCGLTYVHADTPTFSDNNNQRGGLLGAGTVSRSSCETLVLAHRCGTRAPLQRALYTRIIGRDSLRNISSSPILVRTLYQKCYIPDNDRSVQQRTILVLQLRYSVSEHPPLSGLPDEGGRQLLFSSSSAWSEIES